MDNIQLTELAGARTIGFNIEIVLKNFNNDQPIPAKVDTGADLSSIHANNINVLSEKVVEFDFGDRHITMPMIGTQAVKSADGGIEQRPIVRFDLEIPQDGDTDNISLNAVSFNLNDRTGMPDKILLGRNFLEAGRFTVSSKSSEVKQITKESLEDHNIIPILEQFQKLSDMLNESNLTLDDISAIVGALDNKITEK